MTDNSTDIMDRLRSGCIFKRRLIGQTIATIDVTATDRLMLDAANEIERLRAHSVMLNNVRWRLLELMGEVDDMRARLGC